ncbi:thioredoxin family protein [Verticiella alkaliphila]|uniref:thioredoxin family protein n=1 Tax=Verticiella alkaliphila TaxID=2779529 RepID=UPI003530401E
MSVHRPGEPALASRLTAPDAVLVACLCADWCGTCREYYERFSDLATRRPEATFVWIDVEDDAVAIDEDIEDFPTLFVQDGAGVLFYGTMLPHIGHLEKLLDTVQRSRPPAPAAAPDLLAALVCA